MSDNINVFLCVRGDLNLHVRLLSLTGVLMKVAICIPTDLNGNGGVEKHILRLAEAMCQLGVHVDIYGKTPPSSSASTEHFLPLETIRHEQYHIIHTHSGFHGLRLLAMQMTRRAQQRYVHTLHTVSLDYLFACRAWWNWRCYWATFIEATWSRYANHVIAVSNSIRNWALKCFDIDNRKISVITNGYSPVNLPPQSRTQMRSHLNLTPDDMVLLFVGRGCDPVKGTASITTTMNQLYGKYPRIRLLAVPGAGFDSAPWFCPTGAVPHQQMPHYYAAADIFVNASLSEGMPLTIVEAMAAGLPVVASPVGGIPEVITHNQTGLLLRRDRSDLTEQLTRLIENAPLRKKLAQNAQTAVQNLTWQNLAKKTINVYESILRN